MQKARLTKDTYILCNGFKMPLYTQYISELLNDGFKNCIPILDEMGEFEEYEKHVKNPYSVGIRVAADEEPKFEFYTSRLGIRYSDIIPFYRDNIEKSKNASLKMLHFFHQHGN
jgi:arginine decarboxylase